MLAAGRSGRLEHTGPQVDYRTGPADACTSRRFRGTRAWRFLGRYADRTAQMMRRTTTNASAAFTAIVVAVSCGSSHGNGGRTCHNDRPLQGTTAVQAGACTCRPEGGRSSCVGGGLDDSGVPSSAHCVYASCNGSNEDEPCALPGGAEGTCCMGTCGPMTPASGVPTSHDNCGACGNVCPADSTCDNAGICRPGCPSQPCPAGLVCLVLPGEPIAEGSTCVHANCSSQPDGTRCSPPAILPNAPKGDILGICCGGQCVDSTLDNGNCGGCGIVCCPGTQCGSNGVGVEAVCL
jgi:hypothetical protein